MALNPEELDMDTAAMQAKYDQTMREKQSQLEKEDLSDMVAEHAAKQKVRGHRHGGCALCNLYGTGAKFSKCQSRFPSFVGDWEQFMM